MKFRYRERDIADAVALRLDTARRMSVGAWLVAGGCAVGYVFHPRSAFVVLGLLTMVVPLGLFLVRLVVPPLALARQQRFQRPMAIDAWEEGMTVTAGGGVLTLAWSDCRSADMDERIVAIEHHERQVLLVPLRAFRSPDRARVFVELVRTHVRES